MHITWNNLTLSDEIDSLLERFEINGQNVIQEAHFLRASQAGLFARGNQSLQLVLEVAHTFESVTYSEAFILTRLSSLPLKGDLVMITGEAHEDRAVCTMEEALLEDISSSTQHNTCRLRYRFRGKAIDSTGVIPSSGEDVFDGGLYSTSTFDGSLDGGTYTDSLSTLSLLVDGGSYS